MRIVFLSILTVVGCAAPAAQQPPPVVEPAPVAAAPVVVAPAPVVVAPAPVVVAAPAPGIEQWAANHPEASRELGMWVANHPQAATLFFEWDGHHPERSHEFVTWTITHPLQPIETFVATHPNWQYFDRIMETHRPAAEAFMGWCRRHGPAAELLMSHSGGLMWAGTHLFADRWHLEHPGQ